MSQNPPNNQDALVTALVRSFLHTGAMLTNDHNLHAEALPFLQKAVALRPDYPPAVETLSNGTVRRAATLGRENRLAEAENNLRKALSLGLNETAIAESLAEILVRRARECLEANTRLFKAECFLREALALQPGLGAAESLLESVSQAQANIPINDEIVADRLAFEEAGLRRAIGTAAADAPQQAALLLDNLYQQAVHLLNQRATAEAECEFRKALAMQKLPQLTDVFVQSLCASAIEAFNGIRLAEAETAVWEAMALRPENELVEQLLGHITNVVPRFVHNIMDREYLDCVRALRATLRVEDAVGATYIRMGGMADGGYVMVDHGIDNAVVYSLGIGDNVLWDLDMANRGCQIFQYDHTIENLPIEHANFHWSKLGIAGAETPDETFRTLDQLIAQNGHAGRNDLILKVDIETAEWSMFAEMPEETLRRFSQIVGEFHRLARVIDPEYRDTMFAALNKINKYFQLVHAHANNFTGMIVISGVPVYYCMELTFMRRSDHSFAPTTRLFPTPLDYPCIPKLPDLFLGEFGG